MNNLLGDIKYSLRQLLKSPGLTVVAVLSLALGIGANTAIFSLINSMLLKSLPVDDAHELRAVNWIGEGPRNVTTSGRTENAPGGGVRSNAFSYEAFRQFHEHAAGPVEVFAFSRVSDISAVARGVARQADGLMVSGNFFRGLGLRPLLGRAITTQDDRPDAEPVAVLSYPTWQKHFGSDPEVLGRTLALNGHLFTVVGVLPRSFHGVLTYSHTDVFVPLALQASLNLRRDFPLESTGHWYVQIMARIGAGADDEQVQSGWTALFRHNLGPDIVQASALPPRIVLEDLRHIRQTHRRNYARSLFILMAVVGIVLLVACMNVAGLSLARGAMRRHESAVRAAMGASHWHLMRQPLIESFLVALAGASLGFWMATWGKAVLARMLLPPQMPVDLDSDLRVLGFTLLVSVAAALLFGLLPALRSARTDPMVSLKDRSALGTPRLRLGKILVTTQVGLCLLLLVGAGLFARTLINLNRIDIGFNTENLLVFKVNASNAGYEGKRLAGFHDRLRQDIRALPGVQAVAHSNILLLSGWMNNRSGVAIPGSSETMNILWLNVSESFLSTMGIPLVAGRDFQPLDDEDSSNVIIVNQKLVKTAFPDDSPLERSLNVGGREYRIVGVCGDIKYESIKNPSQPTVFFPFAQHASGTRGMFYEVRTSLPPLSLVPSIRRIVSDIDNNIPLTDIKTQRVQLAESIAQERLFAALGSSLALLALLLACIGLYGLLAYNVTRRTGELGIRMALGATGREVAWPILREALVLVIVGTALGLPLALALTRVTQSSIYGVQPHDPLTILASIAVLIAVATLAAWIPARRAARIDPMEALRYE